MQKQSESPFYYRRMPHYHPDNGVLFITFRINQSLPREFMSKLTAYKKELIAKMSQGSYQQNVIRKKIFDYYDQLLAENTPESMCLTNPGTAEIIMQTLKKFHNELYDLFCFTVMPNHVHLLLRIREKSPDEFHKMAFIVKKIKSITAHDINQQLGRQGTFWQREYYDYCVRNGKEILTITNYIMMNPVKAGLVVEPGEWKYTWLNEILLV